VQHEGAQVEDGLQQQNGHDAVRPLVGVGVRGAK